VSARDPICTLSPSLGVGVGVGVGVGSGRFTCRSCGGNRGGARARPTPASARSSFRFSNSIKRLLSTLIREADLARVRLLALIASEGSLAIPPVYGKHSQAFSQRTEDILVRTSRFVPLAREREPASMQLLFAINQLRKTALDKNHAPTCTQGRPSRA